MRTPFILAAPSAILAMLAFAGTWTGQLQDATCLDQKKPVSACQANATTTTFAVAVADKTYRLDDAGNQKAIVALKNRADRSTNPSSSAPLTAKVTGTVEGAVVKVDSIEIQ